MTQHDIKLQINSTFKANTDILIKTQSVVTQKAFHKLNGLFKQVSQSCRIILTICFFLRLFLMEYRCLAAIQSTHPALTGFSCLVYRAS